MEMLLGENIRRFRKERSLTQEQLAEVFGVTVGAVYKWETKQSLPELPILLEMADFFDTSVDVLLGYEMKDNRPEVCLQRLKQYRLNKDRAGLAEAEKALKKYPHLFDIVHESASIYRIFGIEAREKPLLRRALELQEEAMLLLPQNTNPEIGEISLYGEIAEIYLAMDEDDKAIELLKKHNAKGLYSDLIGLALANNPKRTEEAVPYLSNALLQNLSSLIQTVMGYLNVYHKRKDYHSAREILLWETELLSGLHVEGTPAFLDKVNAALLVYLADAELKTGDKEQARRSIQKARSLAQQFDDAPNYSGAAIRFAEQIDLAIASDDLGATAMKGLEKAVREINNLELQNLWEDIKL